MKILIRGRQQGKTTECIRCSAEMNYYIVCIDQFEARRVVLEARRMNLDIPFPMTPYEFANGRYLPAGVKGLIIDNAELVLARITRVPIDMITLTHGAPPIEQIRIEGLRTRDE